MKMKFYVLLAVVSMNCLNAFADEQSESRFITKDQVWKDQAVSMVPGLLAAFANKKTGNVEQADMQSMGFRSKDEFDKQMAFAEQSEDCLKKLSKTNSNSYVPVRYVGDSSELLIHIDGTKVQLYTPKGMVEIDGTNCKAVDGKKNVVDGLIKIAQRSVQVNSRKGIEETEVHKAEQSKRVVEMLQSCGQVDSKFEDYAKKTLKQSYNTDFKVISGTTKSSGKNSSGVQ
jgi:hypothetical protein